MERCSVRGWGIVGVDGAYLISAQINKEAGFQKLNGDVRLTMRAYGGSYNRFNFHVWA
ncbi:hypothetical protein PCURB6_14490 [Paenibacillus curdlanolyticus]|nr:hypothetical protein PCURB6_14490 [Paenibacillus curdlanolyticus]